jgi:predicted metal-dependent phosphoesterase TrpH
MVVGLLSDLAGPPAGGAPVTAGGPVLRSSGGPDPALPHGRADLHVHTLASDGTDGIEAILAHVTARTDLDVLGIADHERIDAAIAARALARALGLRVEIVVGEEVTTRDGHLLALFVEERIRPFRSMRTTIAEVHEQGGIAIPAHPLFPYPLCAQGWTLRRLLAAGDPRVRPDALEGFNPTTFGRLVHQRVGAFAAAHGLVTVGSSDAHAAGAIGMGFTTFAGRTAEDLRSAILAGATGWQGSFHGTASQLPTFGRQLRKYGRDLRAEVGGRVRRDGTGRDLGYPGGRFRPPRPDESAGVARPREDAS